MNKENPLKKAYDFFEEKWYNFINFLEEKGIPLYKITDKIDEKVPSFVVFLLFLFMFVLGLSAIIYFKPEKPLVETTFRVVSADGKLIKERIVAFVRINGDEKKIPVVGGKFKIKGRDGTKVKIKIDSPFGKIDKTVLLSKKRKIQTLKLEEIKNKAKKQLIIFKDSATGELLKGIKIRISLKCYPEIPLDYEKEITTGKLDVNIPPYCQKLTLSATFEKNYSPIEEMEIKENPQIINATVGGGLYFSGREKENVGSRTYSLGIYIKGKEINLPLKDIKVGIRKRDGFEIISEAITGNDGFIKFENLSEGYYTIEIYDINYQDGYYYPVEENINLTKSKVIRVYLQMHKCSNTVVDGNYSFDGNNFIPDPNGNYVGLIDRDTNNLACLISPNGEVIDAITNEVSGYFDFDTNTFFDQNSSLLKIRVYDENGEEKNATIEIIDGNNTLTYNYLGGILPVIVSFDKNYSIIVNPIDENYFTENLNVYTNQRIIPLYVALEKIEYGEVRDLIVYTKNDENVPINAEVRVYDENNTLAYHGNALIGRIRFENVRVGNYRVVASRSVENIVEEGETNITITKPTQRDQNAKEVTVIVPRRFVNVEINLYDENNQRIEGNITVYSLLGKTIKDENNTNHLTINVPVGTIFYITCSKEGYYPYYSSLYKAKEGLSVNITLDRIDENEGSVDIEFEGLYEDEFKENRAEVIEKNKLYVAFFKIKIKETYEENISFAQTGSSEENTLEKFAAFFYAGNLPRGGENSIGIIGVGASDLNFDCYEELPNTPNPLSQHPEREYFFPVDKYCILEGKNPGVYEVYALYLTPNDLENEEDVEISWHLVAKYGSLLVRDPNYVNNNFYSIEVDKYVERYKAYLPIPEEGRTTSFFMIRRNGENIILEDGESIDYTPFEINHAALITYNGERKIENANLNASTYINNEEVEISRFFNKRFYPPVGESIYEPRITPYIYKNLILSLFPKNTSFISTFDFNVVDVNEFEIKSFLNDKNFSFGLIPVVGNEEMHIITNKDVLEPYVLNELTIEVRNDMNDPPFNTTVGVYLLQNGELSPVDIYLQDLYPEMKRTFYFDNLTPEDKIIIVAYSPNYKNARKELNVRTLEDLITFYKDPLEINIGTVGEFEEEEKIGEKIEGIRIERVELDLNSEYFNITASISENFGEDRNATITYNLTPTSSALYLSGGTVTEEGFVTYYFLVNNRELEITREIEVKIHPPTYERNCLQLSIHPEEIEIPKDTNTTFSITITNECQLTSEEGGEFVPIDVERIRIYLEKDQNMGTFLINSREVRRYLEINEAISYGETKRIDVNYSGTDLAFSDVKRARIRIEGIPRIEELGNVTSEEKTINIMQYSIESCVLFETAYYSSNSGSFSEGKKENAAYFAEPPNPEWPEPGTGGSNPGGGGSSGSSGNTGGGSGGSSGGGNQGSSSGGNQGQNPPPTQTQISIRVTLKNICQREIDAKVKCPLCNNQEVEIPLNNGDPENPSESHANFTLQLQNNVVSGTYPLELYLKPITNTEYKFAGIIPLVLDLNDSVFSPDENGNVVVLEEDENGNLIGETKIYLDYDKINKIPVGKFYHFNFERYLQNVANYFYNVEKIKKTCDKVKSVCSGDYNCQDDHPILIDEDPDVLIGSDMDYEKYARICKSLDENASVDLAKMFNFLYWQGIEKSEDFLSDETFMGGLENKTQMYSSLEMQYMKKWYERLPGASYALRDVKTYKLFSLDLLKGIFSTIFFAISYVFKGLACFFGFSSCHKSYMSSATSLFASTEDAERSELIENLREIKISVEDFSSGLFSGSTISYPVRESQNTYKYFYFVNPSLLKDPGKYRIYSAILAFAGRDYHGRINPSGGKDKILIPANYEIVTVNSYIRKSGGANCSEGYVITNNGREVQFYVDCDEDRDFSGHAYFAVLLKKKTSEKLEKILKIKIPRDSTLYNELENKEYVVLKLNILPEGGVRDDLTNNYKITILLKKRKRAKIMSKDLYRCSFGGYTRIKSEIKYTWSWEDINYEFCKHYYCDATQFYLSLAKRLEKLDNVLFKYAKDHVHCPEKYISNSPSVLLEFSPEIRGTTHSMSVPKVTLNAIHYTSDNNGIYIFPELTVDLGNELGINREYCLSLDEDITIREGGNVINTIDRNETVIFSTSGATPFKRYVNFVARTTIGKIEVNEDYNLTVNFHNFKIMEYDERSGECTNEINTLEDSSPIDVSVVSVSNINVGECLVYPSTDIYYDSEGNVRLEMEEFLDPERGAIVDNNVVIIYDEETCQRLGLHYNQQSESCVLNLEDEEKKREYFNILINLFKFRAKLMKDNFGEGFNEDFEKTYLEDRFLEIPNSKRIYLIAAARSLFVNGETTKVLTPGEYSIFLYSTFDKWCFAKKENSCIETIRDRNIETPAIFLITSLLNQTTPENNPLYLLYTLPLDGPVKENEDRNGYGVNVVMEGSESLRIVENPEQTQQTDTLSKLTGYEHAFITINHYYKTDNEENRRYVNEERPGTILEIEENGNEVEMKYYPFNPAGVVLVYDSNITNTRKKAEFFLYGGSNPVDERITTKGVGSICLDYSGNIAGGKSFTGESSQSDPFKKIINFGNGRKTGKLWMYYLFYTSPTDYYLHITPSENDKIYKYKNNALTEINENVALVPLTRVSSLEGILNKVENGEICVVPINENPASGIRFVWNKEEVKKMMNIDDIERKLENHELDCIRR